MDAQKREDDCTKKEDRKKKWVLPGDCGRRVRTHLPTLFPFTQTQTQTQTHSVGSSFVFLSLFLFSLSLMISSPSQC